VTGGYSYQTFFATLNWQSSGCACSEVLVISMTPEHGIAPPYDVTPQYEVLKRLSGTGFPAPAALFLETDSTVLGRPFLVMEKAHGENLDTYFVKHPEEQDQLRTDYVQTIAHLHSLDWQELGLSVLGEPEDDCHHARREIERYEKVFRTNAFGPQPIMSEFFSWMKMNVPRAERTTLCHGDVKVGVAGNFLAREGRISALLDWELVSVGDPYSDLGYASIVMQNGQFWNKEAFISAYEGLSNTRVSRSSLYFWEVFAYVKLVAMGYPGIRSGLTSADHNIQLLSTNAAILPWLKDKAADLLGF